MIERSVEGGHSLLTRAIRRAPAAKPAYLSIELRYSLLKPAISNVRRPRPTQGGARQGIMIDPPELNGLKLWRRGGFRCFWEAGKLLAGYWWKLFGRLVSGGKC